MSRELGEVDGGRKGNCEVHGRPKMYNEEIFLQYNQGLWLIVLVVTSFLARSTG